MKLVVKQITQFANKPKHPICFTNFLLRKRNPIAFASSVAADLTMIQSCRQRNPSIVTKTDEMRECLRLFKKKLVPMLLLHYGQRNDHESEKKKKKKHGICLSYTERKAKAKAREWQQKHEIVCNQALPCVCAYFSVRFEHGGWHCWHSCNIMLCLLLLLLWFSFLTIHAKAKAKSQSRSLSISLLQLQLTCFRSPRSLLKS